MNAHLFADLNRLFSSVETQLEARRVYPYAPCPFSRISRNHLIVLLRVHFRITGKMQKNASHDVLLKLIVPIFPGTLRSLDILTATRCVGGSPVFPGCVSRPGRCLQGFAFGLSKWNCFHMTCGDVRHHFLMPEPCLGASRSLLVSLDEKPGHEVPSTADRELVRASSCFTASSILSLCDVLLGWLCVVVVCDLART